MPFLRFSRDKRGVENFYLVQATANRRGKVRPRVLYWYRSPPDVKVGREPFDPEVRRALEKQYPDIAFDWRAIIETPIPSADADKWRERRRVERAAKHAAAAEEPVEAANGGAATAGVDSASIDADPIAGEPIAVEDEARTFPSDRDAAHGEAQADVRTSGSDPEVTRSADANRNGRRRRRGGGRGHGSRPAGADAPASLPPRGDGESSGE